MTLTDWLYLLGFLTLLFCDLAFASKWDLEHVRDRYLPEKLDLGDEEWQALEVKHDEERDREMLETFEAMKLIESHKARLVRARSNHERRERAPRSKG